MEELSRDTVETAFRMMGELAAEEGIVIDLAVFGGTCLMLASNVRDVTRDVDAVFLSERARGYALAKAVRARLGLPEDWLDQAVKAVAPPKGNPPPNLPPFGEHPAEGPAGLRVFLPTPKHLLAMKMLASRTGDPEGAARDRRDIVHRWSRGTLSPPCGPVSRSARPSSRCGPGRGSNWCWTPA